MASSSSAATSSRGLPPDLPVPFAQQYAGGPLLAHEPSILVKRVGEKWQLTALAKQGVKAGFLELPDPCADEAVFPGNHMYVVGPHFIVDAQTATNVLLIYTYSTVGKTFHGALHPAEDFQGRPAFRVSDPLNLTPVYFPRWELNLAPVRHVPMAAPATDFSLAAQRALLLASADPETPLTAAEAASVAGTAPRTGASASAAPTSSARLL